MVDESTLLAECALLSPWCNSTHKVLLLKKMPANRIGIVALFLHFDILHLLYGKCHSELHIHHGMPASTNPTEGRPFSFTFYNLIVAN